MTTSPARVVEIMQVPFHALTEADAVEVVLGSLTRGVGGWVVTPNTDILRQTSHDGELRLLVKAADLILPDGMPVVWASQLMGAPLSRAAGSTLVPLLAEALAGCGRRLFLLGAEPGVAAAAARALGRRHPALQVCGILSPTHGFEYDQSAVQAILAEVGAARPDVVLVALPFPKQERLIQELRPLLPQTWFLGIGAGLDFIAGRRRRAPRWAQRAGLEWLWRLVQEPRRLGARYLLHDVPFALRLLAHGLRRRALTG